MKTATQFRGPYNNFLRQRYGLSTTPPPQYQHTHMHTHRKKKVQLKICASYYPLDALKMSSVIKCPKAVIVP